MENIVYKKPEKHSKLYAIKTSPGMEKVVRNLIEKYYLCAEGEIIIGEVLEELPLKEKKGRVKRKKVGETEEGKSIFLKIKETAMGAFGGEERRLRKIRKICLVNEIVMPELKGYVLVDANSKDEVRLLVRKIRHARKLLDGTVSRKEVDLNLKTLIEKNQVDVGDTVKVVGHPVFRGEKATVLKVEKSGRLVLELEGVRIKSIFEVSKEDIERL